MARPPVADADRLDRKVDTVLTPGDLARLETHCRKARTPRAAVLRSWVVARLDSLDADAGVSVPNDD